MSNPTENSGTEVTAWRVSPYVHVTPERLYNPHTGTYIDRSHSSYDVVVRLIDDGEAVTSLDGDLASLLDQGWLISEGEDLSYRFRIKYVSLEAHSVCNQACFFCPVSVDPRKPIFMSTEFYERIVAEIAALDQPLEAVTMIQYNEPTVDKRFVDQVRCLLDAGLPPAVFTNGTGLTPDRVDALVALGGLCFLSVNLSTLDRERYREERGKDHLAKVLANLDYAKDKPVAQEMVLTVLNDDQEALEGAMAEIGHRFEGSLFKVQDWVVNNRAGNIDVGLGPGQGRRCGCDYMGSRPIEHIHITAAGRVVLCCQDYEERWVAGNLHESSLEDILASPQFARLRRMVYGLEPAPDDFVCAGCRYALRR